MVKIFATEHTYKHPWANVTSAFWRKYPNPLAPHVKQIDCYERKLVAVPTPAAYAAAPHAAAAFAAAAAPRSAVNPTSLAGMQRARPAAAAAQPQTHMMLVTNRLVACESPIPQWMSALGVPTSAYVAETCVVDPVTREMVIKSRNISGSSFMTVEETCRYAPHKENADWTHYTQTAKITAFLPFVSSGMESFSFNSMNDKSKKGLEAIEILCQRIRSEGLESITSLTATFDAFVAKLHGAAPLATAAIEAVATGQSAAGAAAAAQQS